MSSISTGKYSRYNEFVEILGEYMFDESRIKIILQDTRNKIGIKYSTELDKYVNEYKNSIRPIREKHNTGIITLIDNTNRLIKMFHNSVQGYTPTQRAEYDLMVINSSRECIKLRQTVHEIGLEKNRIMQIEKNKLQTFFERIIDNENITILLSTYEHLKPNSLVVKVLPTQTVPPVVKVLPTQTPSVQTSGILLSKNMFQKAIDDDKLFQNILKENRKQYVGLKLQNLIDEYDPSYWHKDHAVSPLNSNYNFRIQLGTQIYNLLYGNYPGYKDLHNIAKLDKVYVDTIIVPPIQQYHRLKNKQWSEVLDNFAYIKEELGQAQGGLILLSNLCDGYMLYKNLEAILLSINYNMELDKVIWLVLSRKINDTLRSQYTYICLYVCILYYLQNLREPFKLRLLPDIFTDQKTERVYYIFAKRFNELIDYRDSTGNRILTGIGKDQWDRIMISYADNSTTTNEVDVSSSINAGSSKCFVIALWWMDPIHFIEEYGITSPLEMFNRLRKGYITMRVNDNVSNSPDNDMADGQTIMMAQHIFYKTIIVPIKQDDRFEQSIRIFPNIYLEAMRLDSFKPKVVPVFLSNNSAHYVSGINHCLRGKQELSKIKEYKFSEGTSFGDIEVTDVNSINDTVLKRNFLEQATRRKPTLPQYFRDKLSETQS